MSENKALSFSLIAEVEDEGRRASDVLRARFGCSATLIKKIRLYGQLYIDGIPSRMKRTIRAGEKIVAICEDASSPLIADHGVPIRYQDEWLLVVHKAAGELVHPSLNRDLPDLCSRLSDAPLHPVNRLDRDTSGLVIIALNGHAHYLLSHQEIEKDYLAIVWGRFPCERGLISFPIRRDEHSKILRRIACDGKAAQSEWEELSYFPTSNMSLVRFRLHSGRTHQLRVHSLAMGCPILGDSLYGLTKLEESLSEARVAECGKERASDLLLMTGERERALDISFSRQALHAAWLSFDLPLYKRRITIYDPPPEDFRSQLNTLREIEKL